MTSPRYLYFDTATTDQWHFRLNTDDARQPHMIRLAWWLDRDTGGGDEETPQPMSLIVRPGIDWSLAPSAVGKHGITPELARQLGIPQAEVLMLFTRDLALADFAVAFNANFHTQVIQRAAMESGAHFTWPRPPICAMRESTDLVRKPRMQPGGGNAYPKLGEALEFFTGRELLSNMSPIARGGYMATCVRDIHRGIIAATMSADRSRNTPTAAA